MPGIQEFSVFEIVSTLNTTRGDFIPDSNYLNGTKWHILISVKLFIGILLQWFHGITV